METPNAPASNQYVINNVQQLFPINNNYVNFNAKFQVKSLSGEPFQGIVVNQQALDSGQVLQFRNAEQGLFSGEIRQDNNVPDNWYLALKSPKPNKVTINVQTVQIDAAPQQNPSQVQQVGRTGSRDSSGHSSGWSAMFTMPNLLKVALGIGIVSALYFFAKKYWAKRKSTAGVRNDEYDYTSLRPAIDAQPDDFMPSSPLLPAAAHAATPAGPTQGTTPVAAAAPSAPSASPASEGTSSAAILGEDLLAKVNNLPPI